MATLLQQAIDLARAGQRDNAERLLRRVLADQPDNEVAWLWLSGVVRDQTEKRQALQRVLAINPDNELAQRGLGLFGGKPAASEPPQPSMTTSLPSEPTPLSEFSLTDDEADDDPLSFMTEDASLFAEPDEATSEGGGFDFGGDLSFDFTTEADDPADITTGDATHFSFDETETEEPALADMSSFGGFDRSEDDSPFNFDFDATDEPPAADEDSFAFDKQETIQSSGFDFALDDVPDFNFEAESEAGESEAPPSLLKSNVPGVAADDEDVGFDWDSPPAFDFNIDIASLASSAADPWARESEDEVEEMAAGQAALNRLGQFTGPADAEIDLPESDLSYSEAEPEEADSEISTIAKTEDVRQFQQRMMIVLVGALVLIGIATCGLIYYADTAGLYTLIPSMAPEQITEAAPNPRNGAATVDFRGFAGTRARIEWTRDTTVETCGGGTAGLTVDFGEGDQATINNQVCVGETCVFERDLNVEQVKDAVVTYQCGRDAIITLFR